MSQSILLTDYACPLLLSRSVMAVLVVPLFSDYLKGPEVSTRDAVFDRLTKSAPDAVGIPAAVVARGFQLVVTLQPVSMP